MIFNKNHSENQNNNILCTFYRCLIKFYNLSIGRKFKICNNGKDNDGDGLFNLYDPDCQCHFTGMDNLYGTYTNIDKAAFFHNLTSCAVLRNY